MLPLSVTFCYPAENNAAAIFGAVSEQLLPGSSRKKEGVCGETSPLVAEIRGFAEFIERVTGEADNLWRAHSGETSPRSYGEYKNFMQGKLKTTFIRFKNLKMFSQPISASVIFKVVGIRRMPRGGRYIKRETAQKLI